MVRYVRQRDNFRCGPYVLLNSLKWAGVKRYKNQPVDSYLIKFELEDLCCCDEEGTGHVDLGKALKSLPGISAKRVWNIKKKNVVSHLRNNGAVVMAYNYIDDSGRVQEHYALIVEMFNDGRVLCINHKETTRYILSNSEFEDIFKSKSEFKVHGWLLERSGD